MPAVRAGDAADLPALLRIQAAAVAEPWPELLELATDAGPLLRVVETDRPVGYVIALVADDVAYVPELAVDPTKQNAGLGTQLVAALVDELAAEGVARLRLTARAGDDRARSFYEGQGFEAVERVTDHFESADGVVYERRLPADGG